MAEKDEMNFDRRHFHIDRSVSIGHIITTIAFGVGLVTGAISFDRRVSSNAQQIEFVKQVQKSTDDRVDTLRAEIRQDLRDINLKLDQILRSQSDQ